MTIIVASAVGALIGAALCLAFLKGHNLTFYAVVGALGAAIAGILLAGFMVNPDFLSPNISVETVGRALSGALLLLAVFLIFRSRPGEPRSW